MNTPPLTELTDRTRDIFRLVVEQYLATGQPVGSKTLAQGGAVDLSPASIRSVLADLALDVAAAGALFRLPAALPKNVAMEMLLLSKKLSSQEAFNCGFVNELFPAGDEFEPAVLARIEEQLAMSGPPGASPAASIKPMPAGD